MLTGTWAGTLLPSAKLVAIAADRYPIVLALEESKGSVTGAAGPSLAEVGHAQVASGTFDASTGRIHIRVDSPADAEVDEQIVLEGDVTPDAISGRFTYGNSGSGDFELRRVTSGGRP
jgi:hypothetical protein